jgi:hypothetical protein
VISEELASDTSAEYGEDIRSFDLKPRTDKLKDVPWTSNRKLAFDPMSKIFILPLH